MEKVIRDGKVAVLYSPGYGAGWSTWEYTDKIPMETLLFHPKFVAWVEGGKKEKIGDVLVEVFGENNRVYVGGSRDLKVEWLPIGIKFRITEYDGFEELETLATIEWIVA